MRRHWLVRGILGDEFAAHGEVEDSLAQLLDVLRAGSEARQVMEDEAGVIVEGVCLPGWQVGRVGFCCVGGGVQTVQASRHQPVAALLPLRFRGLQLVAQCHQFVHLRDGCGVARRGGAGEGDILVAESY